MSTLPLHFRRVRSFVRRDSRRTKAQANALQTLSGEYFLPLEMNHFADIFAQKAPCFLEIGFGMGQSLLSLADKHRDKNFIGVETHQPGIGNLLLGIQQHALNNLKIFYADALDVLTKAIPDHSLQGVQLFFPDPWPKRRHHERRLFQATFLKLILQKLKLNGTLHLATDWEDYAKAMLQIVSAEKQLRNLFGENQFAERSMYRPIVTKFEARALSEGRVIRELQLQKINLTGE